MKEFVIYLIAGVALLALGMLDLRRGSPKRKRCTARAKAEVLSLTPVTDEKGRPRLRPVYRYTFGGTEYTGSPDYLFRKEKQCPPGWHTEVLCDPASPETFVCREENFAGIFGSVLLIAGILLCGIAFAVLPKEAFWEKYIR